MVGDERPADAPFTAAGQRGQRLGDAAVEKAPTRESQGVVGDVPQARVGEVVTQLGALLRRDLPDEPATAELLERRDRLLIAAPRGEAQRLKVKDRPITAAALATWRASSDVVARRFRTRLRSRDR